MGDPRFSSHAVPISFTNSPLGDFPGLDPLEPLEGVTGRSGAGRMGVSRSNHKHTSIQPRSTMTSRNGKIARRPKAVRHELNCRLSEGEPDASLVEWFNERDDVKTVLAAR